MRRKGELSGKKIDAGWPHQVALPSSVTVREFEIIRAFVSSLSVSPRGHSFFRDGLDYNVYCFADPEHAERFRARFGGEPMTPETRPRWPSKEPRARP